MTEKKFRAVFMAQVPDANPDEHQSVVETSIYELTTVLVKDIDEALKTTKKLVAEKNIRCFFLCPGFTHQAIARIAEAIGDSVAVSSCRTDNPGRKVIAEMLEEVGWFSEK